MLDALTLAAVVIVVIAFLLLIVSALLTVKLYRFKTKRRQSSQDRCSCSRLKSKVLSVEEDGETTELNAHREITDEDTGGSNRPPSRQGLATVRLIMRQAGATMLNSLKSLIHRNYKGIAIDSEEDSDYTSILRPNRNEDLIITEKGDDTNPQQESDSTSRNSSSQNLRSDIATANELVAGDTNGAASFHQEADTISHQSRSSRGSKTLHTSDTDELVAGELNSATSFHQAQHDQLVTGKSSYIGENYPKLELSESPQSSLTSSLKMSALDGQSSNDTDINSTETNDLNAGCDPALSKISNSTENCVNSLPAAPCPLLADDKPTSSGESDCDHPLPSESDCCMQEADNQDSAEPIDPSGHKSSEKDCSSQSTKHGKKKRKKKKKSTTTTSITLELSAANASIMERSAVVSNNGSVVLERSPAVQQTTFFQNLMNNHTSHNADEEYNSKIIKACNNLC